MKGYNLIILRVCISLLLAGITIYPLLLGHYLYSGEITDLKVYTYALSPAEVGEKFKEAILQEAMRKC